MGRAERITQQVKLHDRLLYCDWSREGKLCIYRKGTKVESYLLDDNKSVLHYVRPTPNFVFALTDNWSLAGQPVDWGILPIMARLKAHDLWNRDLAEDIIQDEMKKRDSIERERKNTIESFLLDYRRLFQRSLNDVNTSTLSKKDKRRLGDKRVHG